MKLLRKVGATSEIWQVFIADSSSTTGAGLAGLAFNSGSLAAYYHRDTDTTATAISLATMTVGTFTSSGFKEIDATNMPGWYQFCPPNAALATGAKSCAFHLKGASNMAPLPIEVDLDAQVDVTFWNGTVVATPATAGIPDTNVKNINNAAAATPGAAGGLFIAGTNAATTITTALTTTFTGNLTGSVASVVGAVGSVTGAVGSVTGAVGSVTGNVGGNVTGTVAGVTPATAASILSVALTESYADDLDQPTLTQMLYMLWSFLAQKSGSGTTLTCYQLDGVSQSMSFTLNSATQPTAITRDA